MNTKEKLRATIVTNFSVLAGGDTSLPYPQMSSTQSDQMSSLQGFL